MVTIYKYTKEKIIWLLSKLWAFISFEARSFTLKLIKKLKIVKVKLFKIMVL